MGSFGRACRAAACVGLLLVLVACTGGGPAPSPSTSGSISAKAAPVPTGLAHFSQDEWSFDYPAAWRYEPMSGFITSFYDVLGYLGSTSVDTSQICQTIGSTQSCNAHGYDLPPGNVVITVGTGGRPMSDPVAFFDHPSDGTRTEVGGMATILSEEQQASDHVILTWKIQRPASIDNWVQLDADIRGPGTDALRSEVDALVASFRFTPEPVPISSDPAVAQDVARKALAQLKTDAAYACFPDEAGMSRQTTITAMPNGPTLSSPLPVTCSVAITPTDIGVWKLDLTISWEASGTRKAGSNLTTEWLAPDGSLGASSQSGDSPGS
jgi:hypothetical protein